MEQNEAKSQRKVFERTSTHTHAHCCNGYQICKTQELENGETRTDNAVSPLKEIISSHWAAQKLVPLTTRDFQNGNKPRGDLEKEQVQKERETETPIKMHQEAEKIHDDTSDDVMQKTGQRLDFIGPA